MLIVEAVREPSILHIALGLHGFIKLITIDGTEHPGITYAESADEFEILVGIAKLLRVTAFVGNAEALKCFTGRRRDGAPIGKD